MTQADVFILPHPFSRGLRSFAHIFGGGYAAGYYAYLWTQMLADDGYQWFVEHCGLPRENGQRFREVILSRGNSTDLEQLCSAWRGQEPRIDSMLLHRGLSQSFLFCMIGVIPDHESWWFHKHIIVDMNFANIE